MHHIIKVGKSSIINRLTGRKVAARVRCLARRNSCLHSGETRIQTPEWTAGPDQETHLAQDWWFQDLALGKFRRVSLSLSLSLKYTSLPAPRRNTELEFLDAPGFIPVGFGRRFTKASDSFRWVPQGTHVLHVSCILFA